MGGVINSMIKRSTNINWTINQVKTVLKNLKKKNGREKTVKCTWTLMLFASEILCNLEAFKRKFSHEKKLLVMAFKMLF